MKLHRTFLSLICVIAVSTDVAFAKSGDVLAIARSFPDGGNYEWKGTGVPEDIRFNGQTILEKGKTTYCSGFTFGVVMKAATGRGLLKKKTIDQVREFQKEWYGAA